MGEKRGVPSETIQQIRERIDIVELISTYISLSKAGQNFKAFVPSIQRNPHPFQLIPRVNTFIVLAAKRGEMPLRFS